MKNTRPLLIAVIVMGVLVVLATGVVIVKVVTDITGGSPAPALTTSALTGAVSVPADAVTLTTRVLSQPEGSHIVSITGLGNRLSVLITGGGPDRILFVDPGTGAVTGQLMLGK